MKYIKELDPTPTNELPAELAAIFPNGITPEFARQVMEMNLNYWAETDPDRLCRYIADNPSQNHTEVVLYTNALTRAGIPFNVTNRDTGEQVAAFDPNAEN